MTYTTADTAHVLLALAVLLATAHGFGHLFARLHQPRVVGEILGGLVLGPTILGAVAPEWQAWVFSSRPATGFVLGAVYQVGLLLLMFASGAEVRSTFESGERKTAALITVFGTLLPFLGGLWFFSWFDLARFFGPANNATAFLLVLAVAMAVTSIPVIARIMLDLGILDTPFARIVLSAAVLEDVLLYAVLAVTLGLVGGRHDDIVGLPALLSMQSNPTMSTLYHVAVTVAFFTLALVAGPALFQRAARSRLNVVYRSSPTAFLLVFMLLVSGIALVLGVAPLFGAFVAGILAQTEDVQVQQAQQAIKQFAFASLIPMYFALVGLRLDLSTGFDVMFFVALLLYASAVKSASVYLGARFAGERPVAARNPGCRAELPRRPGNRARLPGVRCGDRERGVLRDARVAGRDHLDCGRVVARVGRAGRRRAQMTHCWKQIRRRRA